VADLVADVLGYSAAAVACVQLVPQVVRTARSRNVAGVSPGMWALLGSQSGAWLVFGSSRGLWPSVVVNVVLVGCVAGMLRTLRAERAPGVGRALTLLGGLLAAEVVVATTLPMAVLGTFASALSALVFYPQVLVALRAADLSGLSRPTWFITVFSSIQWAAYGLAAGTPAIWVSAVHNLVLSVVVVARLGVFAPDTAKVLEPVAA
jgi:MtN3 and saliva related transmembrane protein